VKPHPLEATTKKYTVVEAISYKLSVLG
jgi:hypothetical protein